MKKMFVFYLEMIQEENLMIDELIDLQNEIESLQFQQSIKQEAFHDHFQKVSDLLLIHLGYDQNGIMFNKSRPIRAKGLKLVADAVAGNHQLMTLEMGFNEIGNEGLKYIGQILQTTKLEELDLVYSGFDGDGVHLLAPSLINTTLKTLVLSRNAIGDNGVEILLDALFSSRIETLGLDNTNISSIGVHKVSQFVAKHPFLRGLDLSLNSITGDSIRYLSKSIQLAPKLLDLDLHGNEINDDDAMQLSVGLKNNTTLRSLNLCDNGLENMGARYIADMIKVNRTLVDLRLDDNMIDTEACKSIIDALQRNYGLLLTLSQVHSTDDEDPIQSIQKIQQLHSRNQKFIANNSLKATELLVLARRLVILNVPLEIKYMILSGYQDIYNEDWSFVRSIILERDLIGLIHDDHPFDCRSLLRLCYHVHRYSIY
jgi:Ran GTPase-activating protein (RanGAP) involved in mRNA processing and transport